MEINVRYRAASLADAGLLARLNAQLVVDEGHRNTMTVPRLAERMTQWLKNDYQATLFEARGEVVGYALYLLEPDYVYLRQLYVQADLRRRGIARRALEWLRDNAWKTRPRVRIDVLVGNRAGIAFWRAVGFSDYSITMERR
jgi:GNAT superfamily N-acetyltransferase